MYVYSCFDIFPGRDWKAAELSGLLKGATAASLPCCGAVMASKRKHRTIKLTSSQENRPAVPASCSSRRETAGAEGSPLLIQSAERQIWGGNENLRSPMTYFFDGIFNYIK